MDESEGEAAERRSLRCVWVTGGRALTEQEAAVEIVSEARLLLQEDLAQLGIQWDPTALPPEAPAANNADGNHSSDSYTSLESHLSSQKAQVDRIKDHQERDRVNRGESRDIVRRGKENKEHEKAGGEDNKGKQGKCKPKEKIGDRKTEPETRQTGNEVLEERSKETKKAGTNKKVAKDTEVLGEKREAQKHISSKQEEETSKGIVYIRPESHQGNGPVPERSLTQELAEIVSSPLPPPMPRPLPSSSPMPPPRFRAPTTRVEEQHGVSTRTSKGDVTTGFAASPVRPGRLKHSRALSKVLHSIQTDKSRQDNVQTAHTSRSIPREVPSDQNPAADHEPSTVQAPGPAQESLPGVPAATNAHMLDSPVSVSPTSVPLNPPEAKRRRMDGGEVDKFSSPELYAGDEEAERDPKKGEETFGDSFELDTQTERIIVQQTSEHSDGNDRGMNQLAETENIREEAILKAAEELDNDANAGSCRPEGPDNVCPRFNISLTDSQMELILNTSHQVSDQNHKLCTD